jgi:hypothetical protein
MSEALTHHDASYAGTGFAPRYRRRADARTATTRRARMPSKPVPMLDWPSDLFSDNANVDELVETDFLMQCDSLASLSTH